jgi:hypothetical protein
LRRGAQHRCVSAAWFGDGVRVVRPSLSVVMP